MPPLLKSLDEENSALQFPNESRVTCSALRRPLTASESPIALGLLPAFRPVRLRGAPVLHPPTGSASWPAYPGPSQRESRSAAGPRLAGLRYDHHRTPPHAGQGGRVMRCDFAIDRGNSLESHIFFFYGI